MGAEVRRARPEDGARVGELLDRFNREFEEPTPGAEFLARRVSELIEAGEATVLLAGDGPEGLAVLRTRPALWSDALEAYLAELYVVPERRGHGLGRTLLEAAMAAAREQGADRIELGTEEGDEAARGLYEKLGFTNRAAGGELMMFYERDL